MDHGVAIPMVATLLFAGGACKLPRPDGGLPPASEQTQGTLQAGDAVNAGGAGANLLQPAAADSPLAAFGIIGSWEAASSEQGQGSESWESREETPGHGSPVFHLKLAPHPGSSLGGKAPGGIRQVTYRIGDSFTLVSQRESPTDPSDLSVEAHIVKPGYTKVSATALGFNGEAAQATLSFAIGSQGDPGDSPLVMLQTETLMPVAGGEVKAAVQCPHQPEKAEWFVATELMGTGAEFEAIVGASGAVVVAVRCQQEEPGHPLLDIGASATFYFHPAL